jgi:polyhydroxyalkanoate synthesis repressor PhaR
MPQRSRDEEPAPDSRVVIKKYPNRRLYDASSRRYVNLDDIAAQIRRGVDLQVVDAKTGEDLTRVILTQIIVEDAKGQPTGLPLEFLRQMVMASDRARQEVISWYLRSAFDAYHKVQEAVQSRLEDVRSAALSPLSVVKNLLGGSAAPAPGATELDLLRQRIADLEARLAAAQARPKPAVASKKAPVRKKSKTSPS